MQENLKKKYGITDEELKQAVNKLTLTESCDGLALIALVDLLLNGDIKDNGEAVTK